jgi:oligosaccharide translocation protein RFT1
MSLSNGLDKFLIKSMSYNMLLQITFRCMSFILNLYLIRYVSSEFIGACNFRLTLLYSTIIFLSREPFRR